MQSSGSDPDAPPDARFLHAVALSGR
jgi:hypothetical protein